MMRSAHLAGVSVAIVMIVSACGSGTGEVRPSPNLVADQSTTTVDGAPEALAAVGTLPDRPSATDDGDVEATDTSIDEAATPEPDPDDGDVAAPDDLDNGPPQDDSATATGGGGSGRAGNGSGGSNSASAGSGGGGELVGAATGAGRRAGWSAAFTGVTPAQWSEIDQYRREFGDPNNCRSRVAAIPVAADVTVAPSDSTALRQAIASGAKVIELQGGTYALSETIHLDTGQQLIGADGASVVLDAGRVERGVFLDNGATLANISIHDAQNQGVVLGDSSLVHQVSVARTGYGPAVNTSGGGFETSGSNNCLVSTEAYDGYNETSITGCGPCFNGGNADGYAMKFGASNNTLIDTHALRNSDDGYDFWEGDTSFIYFGSAFDNGKTPGRTSGDGNGYKLGRGSARHFIYRARAFDNLSRGFDLNNNTVTAVLVGTESSGNGGVDYRDVANRD